MVSMVLRCITILVLLVLMAAKTVSAAPPIQNIPEQDSAAPPIQNIPEQDNAAAPFNVNSVSQEKEAKPEAPGAIVNVPSAGQEDNARKSVVVIPGSTNVERPSREDVKRTKRMGQRRSTRKNIHRKKAKDKDERVVCQKISDASGSVLIDCTDNPDEKRRESDSSGYIILTAPESVIILPLKNSTGQKELDWLSMGLWDVLSVKLAYAQGLRVMRIRDYIMKARRPPGELAGYGHEKAIGIARGMAAQKVLAGEFRKDEKGNIEIEIVGWNVKSGTEIFREKLRSSLGALPTRIDIMIKEILVKLGARQRNYVLNKMKSKYVDTVKAWEFNALGYEKLLLALLTEKGEKRDGLIEESIELHLTSVGVTPSYASGWASLGWALLEQGNIEEAKEAFQRSIKIKPFFIEGNMGMGYAFWEEDNIAEAVPFMKAVMSQNPYIEWSREDMKKIASKLSSTMNSRRRSHMSGVQVIGH